MRKHKDFMSEPDYGYIDIESCFEPIFEPPIDFLEECRKRWENRMNPFTGTVERKSEIPGICWRLYVMEMSRLPTS